MSKNKKAGAVLPPSGVSNLLTQEAAEFEIRQEHKTSLFFFWFVCLFGNRSEFSRKSEWN